MKDRNAPRRRALAVDSFSATSAKHGTTEHSYDSHKTGQTEFQPCREKKEKQIHPSRNLDRTVRYSRRCRCVAAESRNREHRGSSLQHTGWMARNISPPAEGRTISLDFPSYRTRLYGVIRRF